MTLNPKWQQAMTLVSVSDWKGLMGASKKIQIFEKTTIRNLELVRYIYVQD